MEHWQVNKRLSYLPIILIKQSLTYTALPAGNNNSLPMYGYATLPRCRVHTVAFHNMSERPATVALNKQIGESQNCYNRTIIVDLTLIGAR